MKLKAELNEVCVDAMLLVRIFIIELVTFDQRAGSEIHQLSFHLHHRPLTQVICLLLMADQYFATRGQRNHRNVRDDVICSHSRSL